jgi:hypothetical protein
MKIDRSNYEIWLIDWLDGNLDDIQVEQLRTFLIQNPDLKEEFDEFTRVRLTPPGEFYHDKINLKKETANLSGLQFEYLCAAYLEKDLSEEQNNELFEIIEQDNYKKRSFELIQKTRLFPSVLVYSNKNLLIKRTPVQKGFRLSLIGLSAAAVTTVALITYFSIPHLLPGKSEVTSQIIHSDSNIQEPVKIQIPVLISTKKEVSPSLEKSKNPVAFSPKTKPVAAEPDKIQDIRNDTMTLSAELPRVFLDKISVSPAMSFKEKEISGSLISLNSGKIVSESDDGRSKLGRFLAKTFREKLLKEKTPKDSPLKGYEIAEAGVSGLNKLLGWEMALNKKNDENGELKSVYFSSKILKFNAPVKKSEPLP